MQHGVLLCCLLLRCCLQAQIESSVFSLQSSAKPYRNHAETYNNLHGLVCQGGERELALGVNDQDPLFLSAKPKSTGLCQNPQGSDMSGRRAGAGAGRGRPAARRVAAQRP